MKNSSPSHLSHGLACVIPYSLVPLTHEDFSCEKRVHAPIFSPSDVTAFEYSSWLAFAGAYSVVTGATSSSTCSACVEGSCVSMCHWLRRGPWCPRHHRQFVFCFSQALLFPFSPPPYNLHNKIDFWRSVNFPSGFDHVLCSLAVLFLFLLGANCLDGSKIPSIDACPAGSILWPPSYFAIYILWAVVKQKRERAVLCYI